MTARRSAMRRRLRPTLLAPAILAVPGVLLVRMGLLPGLGIFLLTAAILALPVVAVLALMSTQWSRG